MPIHLGRGRMSTESWRCLCTIQMLHECHTLLNNQSKRVWSRKWRW